MSIVSSPVMHVYAYHLGEHDYRYCGLTSQDPQQHLEIYRVQACNKPGGRPLFAWLNLFDGDVHVHVLETFYAESDEQCKEREQWWIEHLRSNRHKLLNVQTSAYSFTAQNTRKIITSTPKLEKSLKSRRRSKITLTVRKWPAETIAQRFQRSPYFVRKNGLYTRGKLVNALRSHQHVETVAQTEWTSDERRS